MLAAALLFGTRAGLAEPARTLRGHVPDAVGRLKAVSDIEGGTNLQLAVGLSLRNKPALTNLLKELYNPASPNFHHYLSVDQFTEQFGPSTEDYQKVTDYLRSQGLKVTATHPNRMLVDVAGAAANVQKAFHVHLRVFKHPTEKRNFFAPDTEPWVDGTVPVLDVMGLDNYIVPHPLDLKRKTGSPIAANVTNYAEIGSGPGGTFIGKDFRTAYVPGVTNTGTGQYIGLVEFGPYYLNDIPTYEAQAGLPTTIAVSNIFLNGVTEPPTPGLDAGEQALDIEMSISMAPGATVLYYGGESVDTIYSKIATDNLAKQISCSFGFGIDSTTEQLYQEFVAQGQNFFQASGDSGAEVGALNPPACEPYITLVGGTALYTVTPGGAWQQELAWVGSGGGVSTFYAIPDYQQGINMTPIFGSSTMRNFPDVAMMADTVIFIAANNGTGGVGGTSCSSPQYAGFYALANQQAASLGQPPLGFFNPALYAIGKSANYTKCFHDITSGNTVNGSSGANRFISAVGYDLCTGWGSPNGSNLINALTGAGSNTFFLYGSPAAVNLVAGGGAGGVWITEQAMNGVLVPVTLSVSNLPAGVTGTFGSTATNGAILTLSADNTAVAGAYTATVYGTSTSATQTTVVTIVIQNQTPGTTQVGLAFNYAAIYNDGVNFSGGADGGGRAYSGNLIGTGLSWNGCQFTRGAANTLDTVQCQGQAVTLPHGQYSSLQLLAAAVNGNQASQRFTVVYTDGTSNTFTQSLSDWTSPQNYAGEAAVLATPYRNVSGGRDVLTRVYVYGYSFGLNNTKTVASIRLPHNNNVLILAMTLANDFTLYGAPASIVLTAGGKAATYLMAGPVGAFSGSVNLTVSGLPTGVTASFNPSASSTGSILTLTSVSAALPSSTNIAIAGTLSGLVHNVNVNLSVVAPVPGSTLVSLGSLFSVAGTYSDGSTFGSTGGLDGAGDAYSANLLTTAPNWDGVVFNLGTASGLNAVPCSGQTIPLPVSQYTGLVFLGAAVNASQPSQTFQVNYTDGSSSTFTQSISVWTAAQNYAGESVAVSGGYANTSAGSRNPSMPVNLYGYALPLNDTRTLASVTLPNNTNVLILAMEAANVPTPVSLAPYFNDTGIYTDGTSFGGASGLGNGAYSYSANALGSTVIWDSVQFNLGPPNTRNVIECASQTIALPTNHYTSMLILASGANANQVSQSFLLTYTDGTSTTISQSISYWVSPTAYASQFIADTMTYRLQQGSVSSASIYVYGYLIPVNNTKSVQSLKLPSNANVDILALSMANTPLPVSLQASYNRAGLFNNGTAFSTSGFDNDGNSLSATLLGSMTSWHNSTFEYGLPNVNNVVSGAGQVVTLPPCQASSMLVLAASVNGSQAGQGFKVTYTNGATSSFSQNMSDWASPQSYAGESTVVTMPYRLSTSGSQEGPTVYLFGYTFPLASGNVVQSLTLPNNGNMEVVAVTLSNFTAAVPERPIIAPSSEPQSVAVTNGSPATFAVTAIGTPILTYQWQKNGVTLPNGGNVTGATANSMTLTTVSTNDAASYTVVVSNPFGSIISSIATLTIVTGPSITNQPLPLTVTNGSPAVFTVGATGTPPLFCQWQVNSTNLSDGGIIAGSTSATLTLLDADATNAGLYDVVITNAYGSVTSSPVALSLAFLLQSAAQNGNTVTFAWPTTPGDTYQVQYTTDLSSTNWINLGPPFVASGLITGGSDDVGPDPQRFYRIVQQ
ncbi:MAG TPA: protease pro-enzyme activation domain-containing protein [Verrucomicrobiae bacterium]|jgi:hypothetical protein